MDALLLAHIIEHGFQETAQSALILFGNEPVLLNYLSFLIAQPCFQRPLAEENESHIDAERCNSEQVGRIGVSGPTFVAALGVSVHPAGLCQILLAQVQPNPFLA